MDEDKSIRPQRHLIDHRVCDVVCTIGANHARRDSPNCESARLQRRNLMRGVGVHSLSEGERHEILDGVKQPKAGGE